VIVQKSDTQAMIDFIQTTIIRDSSIRISEHTPLVSSGLVDSFALIEMLQQLQRVTKRQISPIDVSPNDLETVASMLETAARVGTTQ
jgi:acyl carrier protein